MNFSPTERNAVSDLTLLNLRAVRAMRLEDLRIATKHRETAAARVMSPDNAAAYVRALEWEDNCRQRATAAAAAVIGYNAGRVALASDSLGMLDHDGRDARFTRTDDDTAAVWQ